MVDPSSGEGFLDRLARVHSFNPISARLNPIEIHRAQILVTLLLIITLLLLLWMGYLLWLQHQAVAESDHRRDLLDTALTQNGIENA